MEVGSTSNKMEAVIAHSYWRVGSYVGYSRVWARLPIDARPCAAGVIGFIKVHDVCAIPVPARRAEERERGRCRATYNSCESGPNLFTFHLSLFLILFA